MLEEETIIKDCDALIGKLFGLKECFEILNKNPSKKNNIERALFSHINRTTVIYFDLLKKVITYFNKEL